MGKKTRQQGLWRFLRRFAQCNSKSLVAVMLLYIGVGICVAIHPLIIRYIVDDGIGNDALEINQKLGRVGLLCGVYILLSFLRIALFKSAFNRMMAAVEDAIYQLRSGMFVHIEKMGMRFHAEYSSGELYNCINGTPIMNLRNYLISAGWSMPVYGVSIVISLYALFSYDWIMTLVLLCTVVALFILHIFARRKIRGLSSLFQKEEASSSRYVVDVLNGMGAIKTYSVEEHIAEKFKQTIGRMRDTGYRLGVEERSEQNKMEMAQYIGTAVIYFVGAIGCCYRGMTVGMLYAFLSSMGSILTVLVTWLGLSLQKTNAEAGMERLMRLMAQESDVPNADKNNCINLQKAKEAALSREDDYIEFKNVTFSYENTYVFQDFSCRIRKGESVALVGESGCGKSTLTKLLLRLYDVDSGSIRVFGNDIRNYDLHAYRQCFGAVPQSTTIFYGTIWENVQIARPDATREEILRAMEMANMQEFLGTLENGWETVVGNGGQDLSGGQKQRIGIARALLGNPEMLIFDEATSALDNKSEHAIQGAIDRLMKNHNCIIVAHRLSTIRNVDRILVFQNGKIVEEGTYDALAEKPDGVFYAMLHAND